MLLRLTTCCLSAARGELLVEEGLRRLLSPLKVKHVTLPNRFVMQPTYMNMEAELGLWTDAHMEALAAYYAERAHYGASLIVVGGLGTSSIGKWKDECLTLATRDSAVALRKVTDAIHAENGWVLAQAFHGGRGARRNFRLSSMKEDCAVQHIPRRPIRALPWWGVSYVVSEYARFAQLAEEAGFDGVEIPVSEGSLLHNFFSSAVNHRRDRFGGSLENRAAMAVQVLEAVRAAIKHPESFIVSLRLCLHDLKPDGTPMADTLAFAQAVAEEGLVDLLNTSVGMHDSPVHSTASFVPQGTFKRCCQRLKQHLVSTGLGHVPVIASHRIHSLAVAQRFMEKENDVCDLIGLGRPLMADSAFIAKAKALTASGRTGGVEHQAVPCVGCNHCFHKLFTDQRVTCAVNPVCGHELERAWTPSPHRKSVAVVGAGPAGVTCALTLWRRGHDVTLFEKEKFIGGQLNLAKRVPGKESYQAILEYWTQQLRASTINVRLETTFTREEMAKQHQFFHAVVLAQGSIPKPITNHRFPGVQECPLVVPFRRILDGTVQAGRRVVLLGNGGIAHDVASYLLHDPRVSRSIEYYTEEWGVNLEEGTLDVTAWERSPRNNRDVIIINKADRDADLPRGTGWFTKQWLRTHGGTELTHALVENIDKSGVHISLMNPDSRQFFVPCDTLVWCVGMLPNLSVGTWIYEWMKDGAKERGEMIEDFSIYGCGACRDSYNGVSHGEQDLMQAVQEGYEVGHKV